MYRISNHSSKHCAKFGALGAILQSEEEDGVL